MSRFYPVSLNLNNQKCLVVGGGPVAERKVLALLECGARVFLVSTEITPRLRELVASAKIILRLGEYQTEDLEGVFLVIGATDRRDVNQQVARDCQERNLLVNIVDSPLEGNFYVPAVVRRGSFQIAISTDGKSPLLARKIKEELEGRYGKEYGLLTDFLGEIREKVINEVSDPRQRQHILTNLIDDEVLRLTREGQWNQAKERVYQCLSLWQESITGQHQ